VSATLQVAGYAVAVLFRAIAKRLDWAIDEFDPSRRKVCGRGPSSLHCHKLDWAIDDCDLSGRRINLFDRTILLWFDF